MLVGSYEIKFRDRALRVLLADLQEHVTPRKLSEYLYVQSRNELTVADALIIRPAVDQPVADPMTFVEKLSPVFERVPKLPIYLLTSNDFKHTLSPNVHSSVDELFLEEERLELIPALRQAELINIARHSQAILQADSATIFRTPSKSYCYRFLRTGNVQISRPTLDIFFFWMLPWLRNCHGILAETWTISSIVLNATRLLARYAPTQGRCKVEMLCDYYDRSPQAEADAEFVLDRILHNAEGIVLVLFSACMSGRAVSGLRDVIRNHLTSGLSSQFGSLYNLTAGLDIECLCELFRGLPTDAFKHYSEIPAREQELVVVDIDRKTYFPSAVKQTEIRVSQSTTRHAEKFFKDYGHLNAFSIHRDSYVAGQKYRHHAIYPDLSVLLEDSTYKKRLKEKLESLAPPPSIVVVPPHDTGKLLAKFAVDTITSKCQIHVSQYEHLDLVFQRNLSSIEENLRESLAKVPESGAILVLDDVSVSGNRLARYQRSLRDIKFQGQIHYFVGLARPESAEAWENRARILRFREGGRSQNTLNCVELVVLPDWDEGCCPWCAEQELYRTITLRSEELPPLLARRVSDLAQTQTGLNASTIFGCHLSGFEFQLTDNSLFAPAGSSPPTVFAAVSSSFQRLRTDSKSTRSLSRRLYPQTNCISTDDYLGNTFTDPILRASA